MNCPKRKRSPILALPRDLVGHNTVDQMTTYWVMNGDPGSNRSATANLRKAANLPTAIYITLRYIHTKTGFVLVLLIHRIVTSSIKCVASPSESPLKPTAAARGTRFNPAPTRHQRKQAAKPRPEWQRSGEISMTCLTVSQQSFDC